jgi:hypothetical protein
VQRSSRALITIVSLFLTGAVATMVLVGWRTHNIRLMRVVPGFRSRGRHRRRRFLRRHDVGGFQLRGGALSKITQDQMNDFRLIRNTGQTRFSPADAVAHSLVNISRVKRFLREPDIAGAVCHQQNFDGCRVCSNRFHYFSFISGRAKQKVEPFSGCDSTQILPPIRSKSFLQMANPIPVPSNSSRPCSRWKRTKIRSKY